MPTLQRLEVWTDLQCAGGTRAAILPLDHCTRVVTTERTTREDEATIEMSKDVPAYSHVSEGRVIRWLYTDGSFDEWRLADIEDTSRASRTATLTLQSPLMDLAKTSAILSTTTGGVTSLKVEWKGLTPTTILTNILTFCPAHWAAGTVTPTIPVDLTVSGWMPLRALRETVSAIREQGVACELDFRRNGTTGYYIDLVTAIGSSAATVDVRTAKNLLSTTRRSSRRQYAQEVVPIGATSPTTGAPSSIARAWWECTAKSGNDVTMAQPSTGGQMIAFDDQFNGLYLIDDAGARQSITDTVQSTQVLTLASAASVTVGRWYRVALNSSGDDLVRIRKAEATSGQIVPVTSSALSDVTNIIPNSSQRDWTGTLPDDWVRAVGAHTPTKTTTAGLWVYGGQSMRINPASGTHQFETATVTIYVPSDVTAVTWSAWLRKTAAVATCNLEFYRDGVVKSTTAVTSLTTNVWSRVDYTETASIGGASRTFKVALSINSASAQDIYFDSAQVTFTTSAQAFTEGSQPARLWALGNRHLTLYGTTPVAYTITFADLGAWDAGAFPYDTVALGATANVRDTDLNVTTSARIVDLTRNWRDLLSSSITVSTRPVDLVSTLTGIADL